MHRALHIAQDPLGFTLFVALCLHAIILLGVSFEMSPPESFERTRQSLEVMVIREVTQPAKEVEKPDFLAQSSQEGSGNLDRKEKPTVSAPARPTPEPKKTRLETQIPVEPSAAPESPVETAITVESAEQQRARAQHEIKQETKKKKPISAAQILATRSQEIARITAELETRTLAYAKRPRRKAISASTTEYRYAAYLEAWRRKVERIGNLNYPDEAKRQKLYGNLVLHVAVRSDGKVEKIRLLHSSGHKILDDAAIRIVRLAAPYAPFPKDIKEETDVLDITRTWQFLSDNRVGWKD